MGFFANVKSSLRQDQIENLERELQAATKDEPLPLLLVVLGLFGWSVCSAGVGFSLWCIGQVYPVLHVHYAILAILSVLGGGFLFYCIAMTLVVGDADKEYSAKKERLAQLKYEALKEKRLGGGAYQAKEGPA